MSTTLERLNRRLDEQESHVRTWEQRYNGETPLTFLSAESRAALGDRLKALSINYSRLAVDALGERLRVTGFMVNGKHDPALWEAWRSLGMEDGSAQVHTDALAVGRAAVAVWGLGDGPTASPESPAQMIVERDPVSRVVTAALKRWQQDGKAYAVLYLSDRVSTYRSKAGVPEGGSIPPTGWDLLESRPNPLGVVPVVPFVNRGRISDVFGVSEMAAVADLNDALTKLMVDALITSEYFARPRRWATGIEVAEDENGNPVDPFAGSERTWVSEDPASAFGQFPSADMSSYGEMSAVLIRQIGALSSLPPAMLGLQADQAVSADAIRASEAGLVAKAHARMVTFGRGWADVARLMLAVRDGGDPRRRKVEVVWADPATRTVAQEADAVTKLHAEGLLPFDVALSRLGYTPEQVNDIRRSRAADAALRVAVGA